MWWKILLLAGLVGFGYYISKGEPGEFTTAVISDTPEGYRTFLLKNPKSTLAAEARARLKSLDDEAWLHTQVADTAEAYRTFVNRFGDSPYIEAAKRHFHDRAWEELRASAGTVNDYDAFLAQFPSSVHAGDARARAQDGIWRELIARTASAAEYRTYIARYPGSKHVTDARQRLHDLEWATLVAAQRDAAAYDRFLSSFPRSPHAAEAQRLRAQAAIFRFAEQQKTENVREMAPVTESVYESLRGKRAVK